MSRRITACLPAALICLASQFASAEEWTIDLTVRGARIQGTPLTWSGNRVELLARDGVWWTFDPAEAQNYRKSADDFQPMTQGEMRGLLLREFGQNFEISGTGNYLVVHPAGKRTQWAERFEELYRTFVQYFAVRGFKLQPPRFPLVAVAFANRREFASYAAGQGVHVSEGTLGYYSRQTNRILLYDLTTANQGFTGSDNLATIIHEATHQTAFNTGVHNRFSAPPVWAVEGLATMFEAPGVHQSRQHISLESRVNRLRLEAFRRCAAPRKTGQVLAELVASDRLFQDNPDSAYAHAWALTFLLSEQYPRQYARYLARTASPRTAQDDRAPARLKDFTTEFGEDFAMLEARLLRFIADLR